jgi:NAT, N-acetyltransferase, of N-acetylglutamate synthase
MTPQELVLRFLTSVGRPAEAQQYLELFRGARSAADAEEPGAFAVIHVSEPVLDHALDALVVDLRYLAELDLLPVLAFGAVSGARAQKSAQRVATALPPQVRAKVTAASQVAQALRDDCLPLVPLIASRSDPGSASRSDPGSGNGAGEVEADRRFDALAELVASLGAKKLVFLGRRSGLQPRGGRVVSMIDLTTEAAIIGPTLPEPQAALLRQVARVLDAVPHPMTVSVTSPLDLLRELFTVKGAGTLVRRGCVVEAFSHWHELDRPRVLALVEEAFGKPLVSDFGSRPFLRAYVADDYRGAAIVTQTPLGPYLSKFAVTTVARGEGVGRDLWRHLTGELPQLFWRSRADNPITSWYREQCDGLQRIAAQGKPWVVLWRGLSAEQLAAAIHYCQAAPPDFDS